MKVTQTSASAPGINGLSAWASQYDVLFCDVWGVVHDGLTAISEAVDALLRYRRGGGTVVLLTNAPRPTVSIMAMLDRMKVPRDAYDALVSSGEVTADLVAAKGDAPVHHLGPARDESLFEIAAARGGAPRRVALAEAAYVVCTGLFRDTDTPENYDPVLAQMKARDLLFVCANPDIVVHTGDAIVWCAGALAERYAAAGGRVTQIGKPHALIYEAVRERARHARGTDTPNDRILAIGDGMFTDIVGAQAQGIDSLLITSGIHRDRIRLRMPDGAFTVEPAAYAALAQEAGVAPTGHMHLLTW